MSLNWQLAGSVATVAGVSFLTGVALYHSFGQRGLDGGKSRENDGSDKTPQIFIMYASVEGTSKHFASQLYDYLTSITHGKEFIKSVSSDVLNCHISVWLGFSFWMKIMQSCHFPRTKTLLGVMQNDVLIFDELI